MTIEFEQVVRIGKDGLHVLMTSSMRASELDERVIMRRSAQDEILGHKIDREDHIVFP